MPARPKEICLGLIHQSCPMNQVNVSEPVPHIWYRTERGAELFPTHAYHFGLIRSAGAFKTLTHIIERNNLILNHLPESRPMNFQRLKLLSHTILVNVFGPAFGKASCKMVRNSVEHLPDCSLHRLPLRPTGYGMVNVKH